MEVVENAIFASLCYKRLQHKNSTDFYLKYIPIVCEIDIIAAYQIQLFDSLLCLLFNLV